MLRELENAFSRGKKKETLYIRECSWGYLMPLKKCVCVWGGPCKMFPGNKDLIQYDTVLLGPLQNAKNPYNPQE